MEPNQNAELQPATPFDAGDGWDGDSGGDVVRGNDDLATVVARSTPTADDAETVEEVKETPAPVAAVADDDKDDPAADEKAQVPEELRAKADETEEQKVSRKQKRRDWMARQAEGRRKAEEVERGIKAEEERLARLKREADEIEARTKPAAKQEEKPAAKPGEKKQTAVEKLGPEPDWQEYDDQGKSFTEFQKDHSKWMQARQDAILADKETERAEKAEAERIERTQREAAEKVAREFDERYEAALKKYPDLVEKKKALNFKPANEFIPIVLHRHPAGMELYNWMANNADKAKTLAAIPFTQPFMTVVKKQADPVPLMAHLAEHATEAERIAQLPPDEALFELGLITAKLTQSVDAKPGVSSRPAVPVTNAAPPLRHVAGVRSVGDGSDPLDEKHPDEWTKEDWERIRKKEYASS